VTRPDRRSLLVVGVVAWLFALGLWVLYATPTELVDSYTKCADEGYPVSDTDPPTCSAGGRTFLGPHSTATPAVSAGDFGVAQPFEILVEGDSGGTYPNRQEVITSQAGWEAYWRSVHAGRSPLPPLLPVDFSKNHVVALSEGQKPTGGYNLKVTSVTSELKGTVVDVTESIPTITCISSSKRQC
jgi:hypothetical protein